MYKIENLSQGQIHLKFKSHRSGGYTKSLKPGGTLKLTEQQYSDLQPLPPSIQNSIRVSSYNIVGSLPQRVELYNASPGRVMVQFVRSATDRYTKTIAPTGTLIVSQEEFELIKDLSPAVQILKQERKSKNFVRSAVKYNNKQEDVIDQVLNTQTKPFLERESNTPPVDETKLVREVIEERHLAVEEAEKQFGDKVIEEEVSFAQVVTEEPTTQVETITVTEATTTTINTEEVTTDMDSAILFSTGTETGVSTVTTAVGEEATAEGHVEVADFAQVGDVEEVEGELTTTDDDEVITVEAVNHGGQTEAYRNNNHKKHKKNKHGRR